MTHPTLPTFLLAAAVQVAVLGCGAAVDPIDLRDPVVPIEARRFVADAQDGVSIARAHVDQASRRLEQIEAWADGLTELGWPKNAAAEKGLSKLIEARLEIARMEREKAVAELELADAKLEFITAKTAIRHDLATYELEPLEQRNEAALARVGELAGEIEARQRTLEQITGEWWSTYATFVRGGGDSAAYFTFSSERVRGRGQRD